MPVVAPLLLALVAAPPDREHPPAAVALAWAEMGQGCFPCRERGSRRLYRLCETPDQRDADYYRAWAARGIVHPDPEVSMRCVRVLRRSQPCRACQGRGVSDGASQGGHPDWDPPETARVCRDCMGSGTSWPLPFLGRPWKGR